MEFDVLQDSLHKMVPTNPEHVHVTVALFHLPPILFVRPLAWIVNSHVARLA